MPVKAALVARERIDMFLLTAARSTQGTAPASSAPACGRSSEPRDCTHSESVDHLASRVFALPTHEGKDVDRHHTLGPATAR